MTFSTIRVVPAPGLVIPDPSMRGTPDYILPPEGRDVQPDGYWARRLRDGDVSLGTAQPEAPEAA